MIKSLFTVILIAAAGVISTEAKTLKVPNEDFAIASINIPDSWDQDEITNGISGTSPDGAVFLSVVGVGSDKGMDAEIDDTFEMLKDHNVELDQSSKKENKFKVNGLDADELLFQGKDEDGATSVSITFVPVKNKVLVITYWVAANKEDKHAEEVGKIVRSLKPTA